MTERLINDDDLKGRFHRLVLIPSDGGRFEVSIDGKQVFSKLQTGRFPEYQEIRKHF